MIRFFCPTCRAKIQAPDDNAGRSGRCPKCQNAFVVPAASAAELAESISTLGNDIPAAPIPQSTLGNDIPAAPIPQSTRPASPFDVFGSGETPTTQAPPPPLPPAQIAHSAPAATNAPQVDDREEWAAHDRFVARCRAHRNREDRIPDRISRIVDPIRSLIRP